MRLINTTSLELHEFIDARHAPSYAILSHRWGNEVSFKDYQKGRKRDSSGYEKIVRCCQLARERKLEWLWVDSCCIDKRSSAELSEAINSMFSWYALAKVCFAHLADVDLRGEENLIDQVALCDWFSRGWTLQELLAPKTVLFVDKHWTVFGAKYAGTDTPEFMSELAVHPDQMRDLLTWRTGLPDIVLIERDAIYARSAAQRLSWAAKRTTTRVEDLAYCLLGLFDIQMPLLYGEGAEAFTRLQQEILTRYDDESIYVWRPLDQIGHSITDREGEWGMLARIPAEFAGCSEVRLLRGVSSRNPSTLTGHGIQISFPQPSPIQVDGTSLPRTVQSGLFWSKDQKREFVLIPSCTHSYSSTLMGPPAAIHLRLNTTCAHLTRIGSFSRQEWLDAVMSHKWTPVHANLLLYIHTTMKQLQACALHARSRLPGDKDMWAGSIEYGT